MENQNENKLDHSQIEKLTLEIIQLKRETETNIIEIGKRLKQVKNNLPHGHFLMFLEQKVDFTRQTANKFMKIADEFANSKATLHLGTEKLYILTTIPKKDREQFIEENDVEQMSTRKLKQTIKDMRGATRTKMTSVKSNTQIPKQNNPMDTAPQDEESNPTDDIWKDTIELYDEIILRTGDFYYSDNLELDKKENLLLTRYIAKQITFDQLKETIITNKLNIPIMINEKEYKKYIDGLEIYNAYMHYVDLYGYDSKEDKSYTYYSILLTKELDYKDVVQKTYAIEQGETEETRQQWIREDNYLLNKDNITIDLGCEDCSEYICIYINQKLFAHYDIKKTDYYKCIKKLFVYYEIDKKYLKLVNEFTKQREKDVMEQLQRTYDNNVKKARFKYIEGNETYLLLHCLDDTDYIKVFKDLKAVATYTFPTKINLYSLDFYTTVLTCDFVKDIIKQTESNADTRLEYIMKFKNKLVAKAKEQYNSFKKQYEDNFNWDGFDFDDFKTNTKGKDVSIDIFDSEELGFLKDMLGDKSLWRKFYVKTANKIHPDKVVSKGQEAINEAENQMKLLNGINDKIQKCC